MNRKTYFTLFIVSVLLILAGILYSQSEGIKLAVASFSHLTSEAEQDNAGETASVLIEGGLSQEEHIELRKRGAIQDYLSRLEKVQLGFADPSSIRGMSKNLKIDYLTVGSVARFGTHSEVDMRLVNINNWSIVYSCGSTSSSTNDCSSRICSLFKKSFSPEFLAEKEKAVENAPAISVFSFDSDNLTAMKTGYGGVFSEILNSELGTVKDITVVERTHSRALVNEKSMEMVGIIENDRSNNYFRIRGISYKVTGIIRVFRDLISLNYWIENTSTGRQVYRGYTEFGSINAMRPVARRIARSMGDALNNRIGTLEVKSNPTGAEIYIDNELAGKSPAILQIDKGKHELKVSLDGFVEVTREISIKPRKVHSEVIKLEKNLKREEEERLKKEAEEKARLETERLAKLEAENKKEEEVSEEPKKRRGGIPTL